MSESSLDVLAIGNAIVDVISRSEDKFLTQRGLDKGIMRLVDAAEGEALYADMGPGMEVSGGSAANTAVGVGLLGGRAGYIGKVSEDELGKTFRHDISRAGVRFETVPADSGTPTARCLILVTEDAERTMNTYLGACVELGPDDIDAEMVAAAQVTYLEGYLWDPEEAKKAFRKAFAITKESGRRASLSLSDPFCVDRHRTEFRELTEHYVDVLFANEDEIMSLYEVSDFDQALQHVRGHCEIAVLTRSEKGSVVVRGDEIHLVDAAPVDRIVDATGAGDMYAAGFLYGLTQGFDLGRCGRLGALAAAEIISHFGAKPEIDVKAFIDQSAHALKA